ncbi:MAG TPA: hypothetical protein VK427_10095, partial [Kofleriaceae bacterium]|nr:hypothetical protein [Kofleriaceae bacterium]
MSIDSVADQLLSQYLDPEAKEMQHIGSYELPSDTHVERVIDMCRAILFPGYAGEDVARIGASWLRTLVKERIAELGGALRVQVYRALHHKRQQALGKTGELTDRDCTDCATRAEDIVGRFLSHLPELRTAIKLDLRAAYEADPAATGIDEILLTYPGTYAITTYRIAHALQREGAVIIPRMMTEIAHR